MDGNPTNCLVVFSNWAESSSNDVAMSYCDSAGLRFGVDQEARNPWEKKFTQIQPWSGNQWSIIRFRIRTQCKLSGEDGDLFRNQKLVKHSCIYTMALGPRRSRRSPILHNPLPTRLVLLVRTQCSPCEQRNAKLSWWQLRASFIEHARYKF